jgi:N-acetylglutamate synthase-like GNAT family acetyltransferase
MRIITTIRSAGAEDVPAITQLLAQLGYPAAPGSVSSVLSSMIGARDHVVVVAEDAEHRVVAMLSLSSRPVLKLQGWVGTIEELVVKTGLRGRGIGDRLVQYAKGVAAERGWVRLEAVVARLRESHRRGFLLSRGFVTAEDVTYRWGLLEGRHRSLPAPAVPSRPHQVA